MEAGEEFSIVGARAVAAERERDYVATSGRGERGVKIQRWVNFKNGLCSFTDYQF